MHKADGAVVISTRLDNKDMEKDYQQLLRKIRKLEETLMQKQSERGPLAEQSRELAANLDQAKATLDQMQHNKVNLSTDQIKAQAETVRSLQSEWNGVQGQVERYDTSIEKINGELDLQKTRAGAIAEELVRAKSGGDRMGEAIDKAGNRLDAFTRRLKGLMGRALVFTVITRALRGMRDWMGRVIKTNDQAVAAMARLKGALLTLAQPLVQVVIPAFTALVNVLSRALEAIARLVSLISGTTAEESAAAAESLNDEASALGGVGAAAKKAGKELASFDEINKLSGDDASAGGGAASGASADFSAFDTEGYVDKINTLEIAAGGALLVIGAVLTFTGASVPVGLAMMVAGAVTMYGALAENWDGFSSKLQAKITGALVLTGIVLLIVGAVLAFSGASVLVGMVMIAAGAAAIYTAGSLNWDSLSPGVQTAVAGILVGVAWLSLTIGIVMLFTGHIALGLGLVAVSALTFWGASEMGFNWDAIPPEIEPIVAGVLFTVIALELAIGIILLFTGHFAIGLGLIAAAALTYWGASELGFSWDSIPPKIEPIVNGILFTVIALELAIGIVMLFTGHFGIGLGLIAATALTYWGATELGFDWSALPPEVRTVVSAVLETISAAAIVFGTVFLFTGHVGLGLGLIAVGLLASWGASEMGVNWDSVTPKVRETISNILVLVSGASLVLGAIFLFTGNVPLGLALIGLTVAAFFGLSAVSSEATWGEVTHRVGKSLDDTEAEIGKHKESIKKRSGDIGDGLTEGTAEAIRAGEMDVQKAIVGTLESGIEAGNTAMEINSPSGVTETQAEQMVEGWLVALTSGVLSVGDKTTEIMDAVKSAVSASHNGVVNAFRLTFNAVLESTQTFANQYLEALRSMLVQSATMMSALPDAPMIMVPPYSGISIPPIPMLAQGAVIPPNREFMAVLGDQRSGNNIEAPENLIRKIVREESGSGGAQEITIRFDGTMGQLVRLLKPYLDAEDKRRGVRLVKGGAF